MKTKSNFSINRSRYNLYRLLPSLLLLAGIFFAANSAIAQAGGSDIGWTSISDVESDVDVSYSFLRCPEQEPQLVVRVHNRSKDDVKTSFNLTITDPRLGQKVVHKVENLSLSGALSYAPHCDEDDLPDLRVDLPEAFDDEEIQIEISFNDEKEDH